MENDKSLTFRIEVKNLKALDLVAESRKRSRSFILREAIDSYIVMKRNERKRERDIAKSIRASNKKKRIKKA